MSPGEVPVLHRLHDAAYPGGDEAAKADARRVTDVACSRLGGKTIAVDSVPLEDPITYYPDGYVGEGEMPSPPDESPITVHSLPWGYAYGAIGICKTTRGMAYIPVVRAADRSFFGQLNMGTLESPGGSVYRSTLAGATKDVWKFHDDND